METLTLDQLKYPVGKFSFNASADDKEVSQWISDIEKLPALLRNALIGLNDQQLDTPYRPDGWTLRQVVHHLADSHMNAYMRIKLALTEDKPAIKPYLEKAWAEMEDGKNLSPEVSLAILDALHARFVHMLKKINPSDYGRSVFHPESKREMSVKFLMNLYAWHGKHHTAHITSLRERNKW
jgi:hypothetical protein